jgi:hypothetical protein
LDNPPLHWPDECKDLMETCRIKLDEMLEDVEHNMPLLSSSSSDSSDSGVMVPMTTVREASGKHAILPTLGFDGSFQQWFRHAVHLVRVAVVDPVLVSEDRWTNRVKATLTVWTIWMAWRRRRRVSQNLSRALWKPLQEILEAVIPRR